jgi:hypothetical protein
MNTNEKPRTVWPGTRGALRRLVLITLGLLPLSLVIFALLVKDWKLNIPEWTEESRRHLLEWLVVPGALISMTFLASLLPAVQRFFDRLFSRRAIRKILVGLAWLVTLAALFYAEEDWRGWHAWNNYRQQMETQGVQFDYRTFIPKPVPDDQNFAATPFVESWFLEWNNIDKRWYDNYWRANGSVSASELADGKYHRRFMDLVAWEMAFAAIQSGQTNSNQKFASDKLDLTSLAAAAPAVLAGLKTSETNLAELRAASDRPDSRYPIVYNLDDPWGIRLPHLANVKHAVLRLQLKACAELAAGRSDDALADVKLMLYLADSVKDEPFLISYLVRIACVQIAIQPVWEGLAEHAWSDAQLQELQAFFQPYNFVADMKQSFDGERAAGILTGDLLARRKYNLNLLTADSTTSGSARVNLLGWIAPRGWYHLEQLSYDRLFRLQLEGAYEPDKKRVFPGRIASNVNALDWAFANRHWVTRNWVTVICIRHQLMARILLPALYRVTLKAAFAQTAVDEAAIACALERCRLANGQFPETLEALALRFISPLPNDVITGEPYKYHRTADGQFVLYSVGWNEKDDGGVPGKTLFDEKEGDWVWKN